jgi:S1-C subfamily serine protease
MPHNKRHRNALYSLVVLLAILQIVSFTVLSIQTSKITSQLSSDVATLSSEIEQTGNQQQQFTTQLVETYDALYQTNFKEISGLLIEQKENFEQEIKLIKSSKDDFSGIIEDVVKGVVFISAGNSIGTGFIVRSDGYIVTNNHVIDGRENLVRVITYNSRTYEATLIEKDKLRDLALIKIDGSFTALDLANSNELQVGKKVIAIGNPLGLSFTVTEGIISGLDRVGPNGLPEYVQTDVSLNPGNSGGPLIDTQGKVVGINNFKVGGAEALGFALESNVIKNSINLIANQTIIP